MRTSVRRARGFALVLAVFLTVLLAAISTYLLTVSNVQVDSGVKDEQGARAYQAARAGIEWGAYQVVRNSTCPAVSTIAMPFVVPGFNVTVTCTAFGAGPETEGGIPVRAHRIEATGCNSGGACPGAPSPTYVERQLQLTVTN
jgi:MSHA biogenesis protein MshP